jgi:hypothetical protein
LSEKNIETIIAEILASSPPVGNTGNYDRISDLRPTNRRRNTIVRLRQRRLQRNPLYTSLRLIFMGLVILLVPLLFSG